MQHAYVRDGRIVATSKRAILNSIVEDGGPRHDRSWFDRTGTAGKRAIGVYEVIDQLPDSVPSLVDVVALSLVYDHHDDAVIQSYALQELEIDLARGTMKERITTTHRDLIRNGRVEFAGSTLSTHNDAYSELEKAAARAERAPFKAVTRAGDLIALDLPTARDALAAVDAYRNACVDQEALLYSLVDQATSVSELRSIDIQSGWPG